MDPYMNAPQQNFRRDDYGRNRNNRGAIRDNNRGRRERYSDNRPPYTKKPLHRNSKVTTEYQDDRFGYDDDKSRLPSHIVSRVARERPCRTLFVRNVQYEISESEIRTMFEKFGEVKDVFNLIENRGMIFVTFYDVRCSENAKNDMQGITLRDRKIDVHYSLPKEEEEKAKCDRTKNQGTLLYTLKNSPSPLDDYELHQYFSQFGEVKAIRIPNFKRAHLAQNYDRNQRLVEFYDSRACIDAFDNTLEQEYKGGRWDVAFFWDNPYKDRVIAGKRERVDRREREKVWPARNDNEDHYPPSSSTYNPPVEVNQRLEQAQKAQQILSMLTNAQSPVAQPSQQAYNPPTVQQSYNPPIAQQPYNTQLAQPSQQSYSPQAAQPSQQTYSPQVAQRSQQSYSPQVVQQPQQTYNSQVAQQPQQSYSPQVAQQPQLLQQPYAQPAEDQSNQVQALLGLLSQAATQQQPEVQYTQAPVYTQQSVAPIPGMDPATALSQLAALLQQQQQNLH